MPEDCDRGCRVGRGGQESGPTRLPPDGSLWRFSVAMYGRAGVAEACLALQDRFELDVPILLFAAWLGAERRVGLRAADAASARQQTLAWHCEIVRPLRRIRQRMKTGPHPAPSSATASLRDDLKAVELDAERVELALLEAIGSKLEHDTVPRAEAGAMVRRNLRNVLAQFVPDGVDLEAERQAEIITRAALVLLEPMP